MTEHIGNIIQDHRFIKPITLLDILLPVPICIVTVSIFIILDPAMAHPCLIPLLLCGILIGPDAIRWLRSGLDTFDPKGILGIFGLNFFFFSQLLTIFYNVEMELGVTTPPDWRPWIGIFGWINVAGIILYHITQSITFKLCRPSKKCWVASAKKGSLTLLISITICVLGFAIMMIKIGGFGGIVQEKLYREGALAGLGIFRIAANAIMILLLISLTIKRKDRRRASTVYIGVMLLICFIIQFLTSGLLGGRWYVVFSMIWAVGIIHYFWRDITPRLMLLGMVPLVLFTLAYGIYKVEGEIFFDLLTGRVTFTEAAESTNETIAGVLIHDLSRPEIQAWMMYKWLKFREDYSLRYGKTYLWAPFELAPLWLFPGKTPGSEKTIAGTEFMYGKRYYDPSKDRLSGKVYSLPGEALLNFGPWAAPFSFAVYGLAIGYFRRKWISWPTGDSRLLLMPILTVMALLSLLSDSDNVWQCIIEQAAIPMLIVSSISVKFHLVQEGRSEKEIEETGTSI